MPATKKTAVRKPTAARKMIEVGTPNKPGARWRVDALKYEAMRQAMMKVLPRKAPGLTQAEMLAALKRVASRKHFPGGAKVGWWMKSVQLDLEVKKVVVRENTKPLRWHRNR